MTKLCPGGSPQGLASGMAVDLRYTALINHTCLGMLYKNETFENLSIGDRYRGYVLQIREDGKVDLTLKQPGYGLGGKLGPENHRDPGSQRRIQPLPRQKSS